MRMCKVSQQKILSEITVSFQLSIFFAIVLSHLLIICSSALHSQVGRQLLLPSAPAVHRGALRSDLRDRLGSVL